MELSFPSELGYEVVARDAVAAFARCVGIDKNRIEDIKTALSEACINAIEHGNQFDANLRVMVTCKHNGDHLTVEVRDQGMKEYTAGGKPLTIEEKLAGLGPLRGMGLMLITELSDGAEFVPVSQGNCFRLTFSVLQPAICHHS
ncbi:MAG: ATP-binding protein [Chloroflexaceae bacterium]|nr:ATP-binding protein [Chloroflexaceae bacterium]